MSNHSSGVDGTVAAVAVDRTRRVVAAVGQRFPSAPCTVIRPARRVAFWSAIAIPFLMLGLLASGLSDVTDTVAFLSLLFVELVALVIGHSHRRE